MEIFEWQTGPLLRRSDSRTIKGVGRIFDKISFFQVSISVARAGGFEWHLMTTVSIDLLPPKFSEPSNWDSIISFRWWLKWSLEYLLRGHVLDYFQRQDYVKLLKMVTDGKFYCWSKHVIRWLRRAHSCYRAWEGIQRKTYCIQPQTKPH